MDHTEYQYHMAGNVENRPNQIVSVKLGDKVFYLYGFVAVHPFRPEYKVRLTPVKDKAARYWNASAAKSQTWAKGFPDAKVEVI